MRLINNVKMLNVKMEIRKPFQAILYTINPFMMETVRARVPSILWKLCPIYKEKGEAEAFDAPHLQVGRYQSARQRAFRHDWKEYSMSLGGGC